MDNSLLTKTQMYNVVRTTRFWNKLRKVNSWSQHWNAK